MKILYVASEATPYVKTGGLGDVAHALPNALAALPDTQVRVVIPCYRCIRDNPAHRLSLVSRFTVPLAWRTQYAGVFRDRDRDNPEIFMIDNEHYFRRPCIYGHLDDGERFAYFCRAVLELAARFPGWTPDVIHCNDWQTGLISVFLKAFYAQSALGGVRTLFTIHNVSYQGQMPPSFREDVLGLDESWTETLQFDNCVNLLKAGAVTTDRVNTVSASYARELSNPWFSQGLHPIFQMLGSRLTGIVNGIDGTLYDPNTNPALYCRFGPEDLAGKRRDKQFLQEQLGLPVRADVPLAAMVTRFAPHKGLELVEAVLPELVAMGLQLVVLGTGEERYEEMFRSAQARYPAQVSAQIRFSSAQSCRIYAGADLFLMPSRSEPCGLAQLMAMRYGAIPVVRETGGLKDTVPAWDPVSDTGFGFTFYDYSPREFLFAVRRCLETYEDQRTWNRLIRRAMTVDSSWNRSVIQYMQLYESMCAERAHINQ